MRGGHIQKECDNPDCGGMCFACTLAWCKVCNGAEGSLPTECPGVLMTEQQQDAIFAGTLDFKNGKWIGIDR